MPRVPVYQNEVPLAETTRARFQAFDGGGGAVGGLARGAARLGAGLADFANEQDRQEAVLDQAAAKKLDVEAAERIRQQLWTGDNAFFRLKGFDAANARPNVEKAWGDLRSELLGKATTERQRRMFSDVYDRRIAQESEGVARYTLGEVDREEGRQSVARQVGFQQDAILRANDPRQFAEALQGGLGELRTLADKEGWAPERLTVAEQDYRSQVHEGVVRARLNSDVGAAKSWLDEHRDEIDWKTQLQLDGALKAPLEARAASMDVDRVMGLGVVDNGGQPGEGGTVSTDAMFAAIVTQESRGRQFGKDGAPLTSSAGAIGVAQVMPATGPEAAKLARLPWDPQRFRTDAAYNASLGRAYWEKQLSDFGDPVLAAAAYNAGPGRVRAALRKGGDDWMSHVPPETRDYVTKFKARTNATGSAAAPQRHDLGALYARIDTIAEREGWTFERRENAKSEVDRRVTRDERLLARQEDQAGDEAAEVLARLGDGFTSVGQIPSATWSKMSARDRIQFQEVAERNRKPATRATDDGVYTRLSDQYARDPAAFARLNPASYRNGLSDDDYQQVLGWRREALKDLRGGGTGRTEQQVTVADIERVAKPLLQSAGYTTGDSKAAQNDAAALAGFYRSMLVWRDDWKRTRGKWPTEDEIRRQADRYLIETTDGDRVFERLDKGEGFAVAVPDAVRKRIVAEYQGMGRTPSDADIRLIYMRGKGTRW